MLAKESIVEILEKISSQELVAKECRSIFSKARGLMFRKPQVLMFDFSRETCEPIHSLFVFYPFLAIWLNSKGEVVDAKIVKPFTFFIRPREKFTKLIEIPLVFLDDKNTGRRKKKGLKTSCIFC